MSRTGPVNYRLKGALLVLAALCSTHACSLREGPAPGRGAGPRGAVVRVTYRGEPQADAMVEWRRSPAGDREAPLVAGVTDIDGISAFDLPAGRHFLFVQWRQDGDYSRKVAPGDRFAYFGGNPVFGKQGPPREYFINLEEFAGPVQPVPVPGGGTGIAGRVSAEGSPLAGARVSAYTGSETAFRDPGLASSAPTGDDGAFILDLPPGKYYLVARMRAAGGVAGPLRKGDRFGYYAANPVPVRAGEYTRVTIPATLLKLRNTPSYSAAYGADCSIEGTIFGTDGRPRKGVYAALYDNPDLLNRPLFISDLTGDDGRYRIPVPVPGAYFLGARSGYGGSPLPGSLYGRYEGNPLHSVTLDEGDRLAGIDIVVAEVR